MPNASVLLVSSGDDPWMVGRLSLMVIEAATASSLAIIPILSPAGLPDAVRRLRRGLRDVRDRTARRWRRWRTVSFAGLMGGDHTALLMISHQGVDRREVLDVLRRRWPDVVVKDLEQEEPAWTMTADDAADLGSRRRGVEPLRIVVMPQKITRVIVAPAPCDRADARGGLSGRSAKCGNDILHWRFDGACQGAAATLRSEQTA